MEAKEMLNHVVRTGKQGVAIKFYIENFKRMNDLFGFRYCEELLGQIMEYMERMLGCRVYRYVGVEFIAFLENCTQGKANRLLMDIMDRFEQPWTVGDTDCTCILQAGLLLVPGYAADADDIFNCLDLAVARAMERGTDQFVFYDRDLHSRRLYRDAIVKNLRSALEKDEIEVRYRPTYDVESGRFTRAEFYMRIFVPGAGMVGAVDFVPIAEDMGQIRAVDYYALEKVACMIETLLEKGREFDSIALPISPVLLQQADFIDQVASVIREHHIPSGKLAIEVDECHLGLLYNNVDEFMIGLKDLGVELILNNFGSGFSGISRVLDLPVDVLKFNRMFVWQLDNIPHAGVVMEGLLNMAERTGKQVITEGVETMEQIRKLDRFGCRLRQGFYYSPTLPESVLPEVLGVSLEAARSVLENEKKNLKPVSRS